MADKVIIDKNVLLGMGSVIIPKVHILNDVTIGAGSTIIKSWTRRCLCRKSRKARPEANN